MAAVLIDESFYLRNNPTSAISRGESGLARPELPMTATKPFQIPLHLQVWVWFVATGGFALLTFYLGGYYQYWGGRKTNLSRFVYPPPFRPC